MLRACFVGQWRLFRGRPDIVTKGRYVFAPEGTPASPYPTWLWARQWISDDVEDETPLGQVKGAFQFYSGQGPVIYPPAKIIGREQCITQGETPGDISPGLVDGYDQRCWITEPDTTLPLILGIDVTQADHQRSLGIIQQLLYTDANLAAAQLQQLLGPGSTVQVVANSASLIPGSLIGVQGDLTIVVVSGTGNPQQLAMQGLLGLAGPVSQGSYSTVPLWQSAALAIQARVLASPADQNGRIVIVGHSYGGAVANIMTARYLQANPNRDIQLLTWGCPLPGDERLIKLTARAKAVNMANDGDVVTAIPPTGPLLEGVSWFIPEPVRLGWGRWRYPLQRVGLNVAGERRSSPNPNDVAGIAFNVARAAILGQQMPEITAHNMDEYLRRMKGGDFPVPEVLTGVILDFAAAYTPAGYLPCDGAAVSRTTYADLFAVLGTTWGAGDGVSTFNVPDLRSRARYGDGQGPGLSMRVVGQQLGAENVTLAVGQLPAHNHGVNDPGHVHTITDPGHIHSVPVSLAGGTSNTATQVATNRPGLNVSQSAMTGISVNSANTGISTNNTGSGDPVDLMNPGAIIHPIIKT